MKLPSSCIGCPFYDEDALFVPDEVIEGSTVYFLAQNPGEDEELGQEYVKTDYLGKGMSFDIYNPTTPKPLLGRTGKLFNERFLPLSGFQRHEVSTGNAIRCRPGHRLGLPRANDLPKITSTMDLERSKTDIVRAMKHCKEAHFTLPSSVKVIVAMGAYALYSLTGLTEISDWRGYGILHNRPDIAQHRNVDSSSYHNLLSLETEQLVIFPTLHPASLFQDRYKHMYHAVLQDFIKLGRLLRGQWPLPLPSFQSVQPRRWPSWACFDTEYYPSDYTLIRWSLCSSDFDLYCVEAADTHYRIPIKAGSTILMQNAWADIRYLATLVDISEIKIHDLMLAYVTLFPGEPYNLNYIQSIAGGHNRHKHLNSEADSLDTKRLYSALDAYEPLYIWMTSIIPAFKQHRPSWKIYMEDKLQLIPIIDKAQRKGIPIDQERVDMVIKSLQQRIEEIRIEAQELTGDLTFNIGGSKQLKRILYGE